MRASCSGHRWLRKIRHLLGHHLGIIIIVKTFCIICNLNKEPRLRYYVSRQSTKVKEYGLYMASVLVSLFILYHQQRNTNKNVTTKIERNMSPFLLSYKLIYAYRGHLLHYSHINFNQINPPPYSSCPVSARCCSQFHCHYPLESQSYRTNPTSPLPPFSP